MPRKRQYKPQMIPGLYDSSSRVCLVCGETYPTYKMLEAHLTTEKCGEIQIEEMLVEQEILMEQRHE